MTFSCKIRADYDIPNSAIIGKGVCIKATAAGAQIINSKVDFEATVGAGATTTPRVVDADTNGVTIIGSDLTRIANPGVKVFAVNHGGGALVIQNSTIDLGAVNNANSDNDSRAVRSIATSGSIILTGNIFRGYNKVGQPVVAITGNLGKTPQQIASNQFQITETGTIGILLPTNTPDTLIDQYANRSGNTFGASTRRVER